MTDHRQIGVDAFNHVWELMEKPDRMREDDDEMLHEAHASTYHWLRAPEALARAYGIAGQAGEATRHAALARQLGAEIEEEDDREHLFKALEGLPR